MAVMHSPALLIADEPTSALDAMIQVETLNMLATLNRSMGSAILYISHDLQSVASICQRIAILRDGEIVNVATPKGCCCVPDILIRNAFWHAKRTRGGLCLCDSGTVIRETNVPGPAADESVETALCGNAFARQRRGFREQKVMRVHARVGGGVRVALVETEQFVQQRSARTPISKDDDGAAEICLRQLVTIDRLLHAVDP